MKFLSVLIIVFLSTASILKAQNPNPDFVVTMQRDTLYGKITNMSRAGYEKFTFSGIRNPGIEILVNGVKLFFERENILAFRFSDQIYRVIKFTNRKGEFNYFYLCMLIDGKQKFATSDCTFFDVLPYMFYQNKYIPVNTKTLTKNIWPELMQCPAFAELHQHMTLSKVKKISTLRRYNELSLLILKYNELCP